MCLQVLRCFDTNLNDEYHQEGLVLPFLILIHEFDFSVDGIWGKHTFPLTFFYWAVCVMAGLVLRDTPVAHESERRGRTKVGKYIQFLEIWTSC